jgi:MSHA biogenesis protein MshO
VLNTRMRAHERSRGYTLVEMIVALTNTAIVEIFVTSFITAPVDAYFDQSARTLMNDSSETLSRRFAQDLSRALPNSVRIRNAGTRSIVEMLIVERVSWYQPTGSLPPPDRELSIGAADTRFSVFGYLDPTAGNAYTLANLRLAVGNTGTGTARNAYTNTNVLTPTATTITIARDPVSREESVTLTPGFNFMSASARSRMFVVSGPVTYICNSAANARTVRRYSSYPVTAAIPATEAAAQLNGAGVVNSVVADNVGSCRIRCAGGAANVNVCQDSLVLEVSLDRPVPGGVESLRVFGQYPVDNAT